MVVTYERLLLGLVRSLCRLDVEGNYIDSLVYDTMVLMDDKWAQLAEDAATTHSFADLIDANLGGRGVKTIEDLSPKH